MAIDIENELWKPVLQAVGDLCKKEPEKILMIAIDGMSASGKTTLAKVLGELFGCNVYHMDDFFLRKEQRSEQRLKEIGGNVDYERFKELLLRIRQGMGVYYQAYDCKKQELKAPVWMEPTRLNIIEGAYSMHSYFGNVYDLRIGMVVEPREQIRRILHRNGREMLTRFEKEWIPKENAYFEKFEIFEKSDLQIDNSVSSIG